MTLENFTREERVRTPRHHIDPGFINHRQIFSSLGHKFREFYESKRQKNGDHLTAVFNDHLLVTYILSACNQVGTKTLGEILSDPKEGELFCSTEEVEGNDSVYDSERVVSKILLPYDHDREVTLEYGTKHFVADTGKVEMSSGGKVTIIAGIRKVTESQIIAYPLVMGAPSFDHLLNENIGLDLVWHGWDWYQIYPSDIDQFSKIADTADPEPSEWQSAMEKTPENNVKQAFCEILNDISKKDWGGELNDHFTTATTLSGERVTSAFLLKGPSSFKEMTPKHLGKNADQIYRLSMAPADLLIVQHSHDIGEAVRATLRAFAVNPANPRRYCFIDGKDTYKILKAYDKL